MKSAVIVFPGSNCDRDAQTALRQCLGQEPEMVWHKEASLPDHVDLVMVPGGFSYGDYLRAGAIAGNSPIISALRAHVDRGGYVLGVCNGFQILTETGILPGALLRNSGLDFVCKQQALTIENANTAFTSAYDGETTISVPVAHHDGNFTASEDELDRLEGEGQVAFRYEGNPNGSARDIAGVTSANGRVLGMMPHPERAVGEGECGYDGVKLFESLLAAI